ncbi:hypothetical protein [Rhodococcus zopfii]|uniref:hypothetical protein n=1 Tax=Rhodococcus zopfii TaxID=43772 RepID=UPI00093361F1|nr:hypothetical protein [Rhodococcus zopfii]
MGTSYELRDARRKNKRIAAQLIAVNTLHREVNGTCVFCDVPAPCPTRTVSRAARRLVAGDDGPRVDARTAGETAVARYIANDGIGVSSLDDHTDSESEGVDR